MVKILDARGRVYDISLWDSMLPGPSRRAVRAVPARKKNNAGKQEESTLKQTEKQAEKPAENQKEQKEQAKTQGTRADEKQETTSGEKQDSKGMSPPECTRPQFAYHDSACSKGKQPGSYREEDNC